MGKSSPQKKEKRARTRLLFPILGAFLLLFLPISIQLAFTFGLSEPFPTAVAGEVDLTGHNRREYQTATLTGEIEFYPNSWIVSEPETVPEAVPFHTPGVWVGYSDGKGGTMGRDGYASYRYVLKGMRAGDAITPARNLDVASRIFLNGKLCFQAGELSKTAANPFVDLSNMFSSYVTVPESGIVEFVMEVGNSGSGGPDHIGLFYRYGTTPSGFATRAFAPFATGAILTVVVATSVFVIFSPRRKSAFALVGVVASTAVLYLFSRDSFFIGLELFYSGLVFGGLTLFGFISGIICLLLYGLFAQKAGCSKRTFFGGLIGLTLLLGFVPLVSGTPYLALILFLMSAIPVAAAVRGFVLYARGRGNLPFNMMCITFGGYGLLLALFALDIIPVLPTLRPTLFSGAIALEVFATAFGDILRYSVMRRDKAILENRYRAVNNRALAYLTKEEDILTSLQWIGKSYETSVALGDKRLVSLSAFLRRRLMTLRENSIPLSTEAEIESGLLDLTNSIHNRESILLLDVDQGQLMVPPLIFEGVIAEISSKINENEAMVISEYRRAVRLNYPRRIELSEAIKNNISERCSLLNLWVHYRPGTIIIVQEAA